MFPIVFDGGICIMILLYISFLFATSFTVERYIPNIILMVRKIWSFSTFFYCIAYNLLSTFALWFCALWTYALGLWKIFFEMHVFLNYLQKKWYLGHTSWIIFYYCCFYFMLIFRVFKVRLQLRVHSQVPKYFFFLFLNKTTFFLLHHHSPWVCKVFFNV